MADPRVAQALALIDAVLWGLQTRPEMYAQPAEYEETVAAFLLPLRGILVTGKDHEPSPARNPRWRTFCQKHRLLGNLTISQVLDPHVHSKLPRQRAVELHEVDIGDPTPEARLTMYRQLLSEWIRGEQAAHDLDGPYVEPGLWEAIAANYPNLRRLEFDAPYPREQLELGARSTRTVTRGAARPPAAPWMTDDADAHSLRGAVEDVHRRFARSRRA